MSIKAKIANFAFSIVTKRSTEDKAWIFSMSIPYHLGCNIFEVDFKDIASVNLDKNKTNFPIHPPIIPQRSYKYEKVPKNANFDPILYNQYFLIMLLIQKLHGLTMEAFPWSYPQFSFFHVYQLNLLLNKLSIKAKIANIGFS